MSAMIAMYSVPPPAVLQPQSALSIAIQANEIVILPRSPVSVSNSRLFLDGRPIGFGRQILSDGMHSLSYELQDQNGSIIESAEQIVYPPDQRTQDFDDGDELYDSAEFIQEQVVWSRALPQAPFDTPGRITLQDPELCIRYPQADSSCLIRIVDDQQTRELFFENGEVHTTLNAPLSIVLLIDRENEESVSWIAELKTPSDVSALNNETPEDQKSGQDADSQESKEFFSQEHPSDRLPSQQLQWIEPESKPVITKPDGKPVPDESSLQSPGTAPPSLSEAEVVPEPVLIPEPELSVQNISQPLLQPAAESTSPSSLQEAAFEPTVTIYPDTPGVVSEPMAQISTPLSSGPTTSSVQEMAETKTSDQQKVLQPVAALSDSMKAHKPGSKIYAKDASSLSIDVKNGSLDSMEVISLDSSKTYTDLSEALECEEGASFEVRAKILDENSQQAESIWTVVSVGEPLSQQLSLPGHSGSRQYSIDESGRIIRSSTPKNSSVMLCRGFEQTEGLNLRPGEDLRLYIQDPLSSYTLMVDGKEREAIIREDELSQPYIPIRAGLNSSHVELLSSGKRLYEGTLESAPVWPLALIGCAAGAAAGWILDVRRKRLR